MGRLWLAVAALALATCGCSVTGRPQANSAEPETAFAFTSVNVLPMTAGEPMLRDQDVVVVDGRIVAVGPSRSVRIPRSAARIDGRGKYLMPGLADMHVHLEYFDSPAYLQLFLANGVTFVRSMDGRPNILEWRGEAAAGSLLSPLIYTAGPVLDGDPPRRSDNVALATAEQARAAVAEQAEAGYDFIKVYNHLTPETFRAIVAAAEARGLPVGGHIPNLMRLDEMLAARVVSIEHLGDYVRALSGGSGIQESEPHPLTRRLGFDIDAGRMEALASALAGSSAWAVPTMITDDHWFARPELLEQWMSDPDLAVIDRGIVQYWRGAVARSSQRLANEEWSRVDQGRTNRLALLGAFRRAGVKVLVGTDTPLFFVVPGRSVHEELANYVQAGFSPAEALAAATREPARFLGQEASWGTVEAGKRADLLLLEANPLEDIGATRRIAGVMAQGRWLDSAALGEMRSAVERVAAASE